MPPLLMSAIFSMLLNLLAPHSNVALPHVAPVVDTQPAGEQIEAE